LSERGIRRQSHKSVRQLEQAVYDWMAGYNDDPKPFTWVKTADQILGRIRRFCERALQEARGSIANFSDRTLGLLMNTEMSTMQG